VGTLRTWLDLIWDQALTSFQKAVEAASDDEQEQR